jgi:hypothetical protein
MRNFLTLDHVTTDATSGIISITSSTSSEIPRTVSMRREGGYVAISASSGPLEIALRLRFVEFGRTLARLRPVQGLQTTRQVGTGQAFMALGLQEDGSLVVRPTIVADATGHMCFNLRLTDTVRQTLFDWLPISEAEDAPDV